MEQATLNRMFLKVAVTVNTWGLESLLSYEGAHETILSENVLHCAGLYGYEDLVKILLNRSPLLERVKDSTMTESVPLHLAAENGNLDICKWLIETYPAACYESDVNGMNPLHRAALEGHHLVCEELLDKCPMACVWLNSLGMNPLHIAALHGKSAVLRSLLNTGLTNMAVKQRLPHGQTILHSCAASGHLESLRILAEKPHMWSELRETKDDDGNTMLHIAVANMQHEIVDFLISENKVTRLSKDNLRKSEYDLTKNGEMKLALSTLVPAKYEFVGVEMKMLFATLLATLACQIIGAPPGGTWQDATSGHTPGEPIILHTHPDVYGYLTQANLLAFTFSIGAIILGSIHI